jgi:transcriptional regulator with XRE-family HTH domain
VAAVSSPTVRRRELGALLRTLRAEAGLTVEQVADQMLCSPSKVSRLETGHRGASARDIRDLCDIYSVTDPAERDRLTRLAREGKGQAWWQPFDVPYATYIGLEAEAISITDFESGVVPGLLQTMAYARVLHEAIVPRLSADVIDQRIQVRRRRQDVLMRDPSPQLLAIMDEGVLHRVVGGRTVMRDQLERLVEASALPNVTIQVIPYEAGAHTALDSTFILLEFKPPVVGVVYVDGLAGQLYLEREQDVQRYKEVLRQLRALSLSPQDSVELVADLCRKYQDKDH